MESPKPEPRTVFLTGKRVAIATPCYGNSLTSQYVQSLAATIPALIHHGMEYSLLTLNKESIISRARNTLSKSFMNGDWDYLFFIDADMGWKPEGFLRMIAADKEIVGGAGPRKEFPMTFCANLPLGDAQICEETGLLRADEIGTGFMCIKREALQKMIDADPNNFFIDQTTFEKVPNLFENKVIAYKFWSEDYTFCKKWRATGGEIWVDPSIHIQHVGDHVWEGSFGKFLMTPETEEAKNDAN